MTVRLGIAVAVFFAAAITSSVAHADPRNPTHIACIGDSITQGVGASSDAKGWVSVLQGLVGSGVKVQNFGLSGRTMLSWPDEAYTKQGPWYDAQNFVKNAGAGARVDVIIMLGTNDSRDNPNGIDDWKSIDGKTAAQAYRSDYEAMIDTLAHSSTKPVIYLAYPPTAYSHIYDIDDAVIAGQIIPVIKAIAGERGLPVIDVHAGTANMASSFGDGVHPTDAGHAKIAQVMRDGLMRVPTLTLARGASTVDVEIDATTGDSVFLSRVDFVDVATNKVLGTATSSPFALHWVGVADGNYTVTAKGIDTTGATGTAAPLSLTVKAGSATPTDDTKPPSKGTGTIAPGGPSPAPATADASGGDGGCVIGRQHAKSSATWITFALGVLLLSRRR